MVRWKYGRRNGSGVELKPARAEPGLQQTAAARRAFYRSSLSSGGLSILLGLRFDAKRAAELGLVTRVVPDQELLASATATARELAARTPAALQACKRLMRSSTREQLERAVKLENEEFSARVRSAEAREAFTAFLEKRRPNFTGTNETAIPKARAA